MTAAETVAYIAAAYVCLSVAIYALVRYAGRKR